MVEQLRLLFADFNITDLLQSEHPEILARIGAGYGKRKVTFGVAYKISNRASLKWGLPNIYGALTQEMFMQCNYSGGSVA